MVWLLEVSVMDGEELLSSRLAWETVGMFLKMRPASFAEFSRPGVWSAGSGSTDTF